MLVKIQPIVWSKLTTNIYEYYQNMTFNQWILEVKTKLLSACFFGMKFANGLLANPIIQ